MHGLRRLHSYPSGSDTDTQDVISPPRPPVGKPPVPEKNSEVLQRYSHKKLPPPPPPRSSSSRSPQSPTSPNTSKKNAEHANVTFASSTNDPYLMADADSGSESNNSQDNSSQRQMQLEMRHQELLKKQKHLQEQYQRLQQMSKSTIPLGTNDDPTKLGNDSNFMKSSETIITTNKVYETEIL